VAGLKQWERDVLQYARVSTARTNAFGIFSLYGYIVAAGWALRLFMVIPSGLWPLLLPKDLMQEKSKSVKERVNVDKPKEQE
jgi:hypothetical protein